MKGDVEPRGDVEDQLFRRISWHLLPLLLLCCLIAYLDRVNVSFAKLRMLDDLKLSESDYGLGAGIFFVGFVFFEVPSNLLLYRFGARRWIATIMVAWGALCAATLFSKTPQGFWTLRFLFGAAEAGFFPGAVYYLAQWYPLDRQGRVISLLLIGAVVGGAVDGPLCGWILDRLEGQAALHGWQWLFLLTGALAIAAGLAFFWTMPDKPSELQDLRDTELRRLDESLKRGQRTAELRSDRIADALKQPAVWLLGAVALAVNLGIYAVVFWTPTLVAAAGVRSYTLIGWIAALPYAAAGLGMLALGYSSDRLRERRWHIVLPCLLGVLGLLVSVRYESDLWLSIIGLTAATAGLIGSTPLIWALASSLIRGRAAAVGFAIINSLGGVGAFIGPYLTGLLRDLTGSTDLAFQIISALVFCGSLSILAISPQRDTRPVS